MSLKTRAIELIGRDRGTRVTLRELPALVADRHARAVLVQMGVEPDGGIATLAFGHSTAARALADHPLLVFVDATAPIDLRRDIRDWRNIDLLAQSALLLHADFLIGREAVEPPVTMQAQAIMRGASDVHVTFCSAQIAAVLDSRMASWVELETVLSTEDVFNMVEILNVAAIREWHAHERGRT